ncbi:MAG: enoyl-CoA hydratase/isomerase family protein [Gammaproteobacteria bacterium]
MTVECFVQDNIGWMLLKRPKSLHALTLPMIDMMTTHLLQWQRDPEVHAVVIQAEPGKAFCAGGDIRQIFDLRGEFSQQLNFFEREYRLNQLINDFPKPYIALMDGITMGGGVGIALHGSHPVAGEHFSFAMPETGIGFFPDIGASHILAKCPGNYGFYLGLSGDQISAKDALGLNLVSAIVPAQQFSKLKDTLAHADLSTNAHEMVSQCIHEFSEPAESSTLLKKQEGIDACFVPDNMERIMDRLAQRKETWFQDLRERLITKSPLSLKVTLQQLRMARSKTMAACLEMDGRLVRHFLQDQNFYEGVRAAIVDKDKRPHWQPLTLGEVTPLMVNRYFEVG